MIKTSPTPELAELLATFEGVGGVIEFAFYDAETIPPPKSSHQLAAQMFLTESHSTCHKEKLTGYEIPFHRFWGRDRFTDLDGIPDGFKSAFFLPPYGLKGRIAGNEELFAAIRQQLLPWRDPSFLTIYAWNTECSKHFDAGREWWGTFFWTFNAPIDSIIRVIAASATD